MGDVSNDGGVSLGVRGDFLQQHLPHIIIRNNSADGRLEDGYLAWSSIYMHEWFGYIIYTPLTPDQEVELVEKHYVPQWMYDFYSLPNVAIPLSYFCIGIALQLLRTPLIVYLIEDLNATPAQVNVLFTVSK
jgi:hypothetical protein